MTPFYFGSGARRLFGIYQPPAQGMAGKRAAVFCNPLGEEYTFAHRALRRMATALSLAGMHTLRFDYFGTGDSAGEAADGEPVGWRTDIAQAIEELNDIVGSRRASLIGLRSGAALAADLAAQRHDGIDALVLWDPVACGCADGFDADDVSGHAPPDETAAGLPLVDGLPSLPLRNLVLITEPLRWHAQLSPAAAAPASGPPAVEFLTDVQPWIEEYASAGQMPMQVIQRVAAWLP